VFCYTSLEKLTNDKHSSLLQKSVIYGQKKFYNIGPWYRPREGATTLSITTLSIMGQVTTLSINDTQHNSIEGHYAECRYVECRDYLNVAMDVDRQNVVMLSVVAPEGGIRTLDLKIMSSVLPLCYSRWSKC
jgi:hypothetical protein